MLLIPLGKVAVAVAGTPVKLSDIAGAQVEGRYVDKVKIRTHSGNTGKVYVGSPAMVKGTFAGVMGQLLVPAATGLSDEYEICSHTMDGVDLASIALDADVSGEGPLVTISVG